MNTRMKIIIGVVFAALVAFAGLSLSKSNDEIAAGYTAAVTKAKAENKMVLVDVYTDWCVWCKRMDKEVYTRPEVQAELNKYFTIVKLNAESKTDQTFRGGKATEETIAKTLQVSGYPTTVFMTENEQVIQAVPGYIKAPDFVMVLRYIGTKAYEKQPFEEWRKTQG